MITSKLLHMSDTHFLLELLYKKLVLGQPVAKTFSVLKSQRLRRLRSDLLNKKSGSQKSALL